MATTSPTPMGGSHFAHRRPVSRNVYMNPPTRPQASRADSVPTAPAHARTYSLNDSSDDEIPFHMLKFSAATNALLNGSAPVESKQPTPPPELDEKYNTKLGTVDPYPNRISPAESRVHSPMPRRVVRLSGTPSTLRRSTSLSSAVKRRTEQAPVKLESPLDLNTPAQIPRTVRIPGSSFGTSRLSAGSSGNMRNRANLAVRNDETDLGHQEIPATEVRNNLVVSQGSVSKYGSSTIGRTRYGEDPGLQSSMRVKRLGKGQFLSGPARRGRRRMTEEEQSPVEEQGDPLDDPGNSQEPQNQESRALASQEKEQHSSQEGNISAASLYKPTYRDFATNGSPVRSKDIINSVLRSRSPPPPTLSESRRLEQNRVPQVVQPFKVPAPRVDLPSTYDQENEAPPTFKRNKQAPLVLLDKLEKVPVRSQSIDMDAVMKAVSPERRPLAARSRNTPLRPAPPPPKMSILDAATSNAGAAASNAGQKRYRLKVNGKVFTKLDVIGRGGSSRVYRVMAENSTFYALKRVSLDDAEESAVRGFKGEIDLLKKLAGVDRVIRLWDWELNEEKQILSVLMEMGELDMNQILQLRFKSEHAKFDASFVRYYWKEMLECLQAIHECDVVHSDLKPHNFVLVKGILKLIDFGIANAIETDETVNVHRETQIGTPNYMSPESLIDSNAKPDSRGRIPNNEPRLMKLGKPSDIWSLGCILYQMVYGRAPFAHILNAMHRCQAIINWKYEIEYPSLGIGNVPVPGSLIRTLKRCLNRDQHLRPTATELLSDRDPFLNPVELDEDAIPLTEELLGRILLNAAARFKERTPTEAELLTLWPKGYLDRLKKNMANGKIL